MTFGDRMPPPTPRVRRNDKVATCLSEAEANAFRARAEERDMSVSHLARLLILNFLKAPAKPPER